jgi:hypothetical protein
LHENIRLHGVDRGVLLKTELIPLNTTRRHITTPRSSTQKQHSQHLLDDQQVLRDMGPYIALAPRPNKPIKPTKKAALKDNDTEDDDHEDA